MSHVPTLLAVSMAPLSEKKPVGIILQSLLAIHQLGCEFMGGRHVYQQSRQVFQLLLDLIA